MTAMAPESSAILAWSSEMTSIMTPRFNISAKPVFKLMDFMEASLIIDLKSQQVKFLPSLKKVLSRGYCPKIRYKRKNGLPIQGRLLSKAQPKNELGNYFFVLFGAEYLSRFLK